MQVDAVPRHTASTIHMVSNHFLADNRTSWAARKSVASFAQSKFLTNVLAPYAASSAPHTAAAAWRRTALGSLPLPQDPAARPPAAKAAARQGLLFSVPLNHVTFYVRAS